MKNANLHYQNTELLSKSMIGRCSKVLSRRPNRYSLMKKFKKSHSRIKDLGISQIGSKNKNYPPSKYYVLTVNLVLNWMNFSKLFINCLIQPKIVKSISTF